MLEPAVLLDRLTFVIPLILFLTVHEWAHAISAYKLGDDTAERMGRLTLNPIPHIDPIGTLLLPMLGIPFGYARPVPVDPARFSRKVRMRTGMMITAAAGPISNVLLAVVCVGFLWILYRIQPAVIGLEAATSAPLSWILPTVWEHQRAIESFLRIGVMLNVILALFNILPFYPLDGSRVADGLMPDRWRPAWETFAKYSPMAILFVLVSSFMFGVSIFTWPIRLSHALLASLISV